MQRREFLTATTQSAAALAGAAWLQDRVSAQQAGPNDRINVCVMGVRGRGGSLLSTFAAQPQVFVKYVCDLDETVLNSRADGVTQATGRAPEKIKDFRRALADRDIDALVIGTPDHWHALPTIMACQAGKDVYVEKPDGHNTQEGRVMVAAGKKYNRIIQLGTQSRSGGHFLGAMEYIRAGHLGQVRFAKAWESTKQNGIGRPADAQPPATVDYDFWLGPAPQRPFNPVRFHGNWRWFFDLGTGDLGNDGVHRLDVARWALETGLQANGQTLARFPRAIGSLGAKCYFDDLQEWPDNQMTTFDYGNALLTYELRIWCPYPMEGEGEAAGVFGDQGYMVLGNTRWRHYGPRGQLVREERGTYSNDVAHIQNFLECLGTRRKPNADLETIGHPSSLLCHLGNASWRAGRTLQFDPDRYTCVGDEPANQFLTRAVYREPWVLPRIEAL